MRVPVGYTAIVDVSSDLIAVNPDMQHMPSGLAHGSRWIPDCTEREWNQYMNERGNREAFCLLAVFYGWIGADDHQVIYEKLPPHKVHSVDHGHFFPGSSPEWIVEDLRNAPDPKADARLMHALNFRPDELKRAAEYLDIVSNNAIIAAVAAPPDEWGLTLDERCELISFLVTRRDALVRDLLG